MREDVFMAVVAIHFAANLLSGLLYEIMHIFAINYCSLYYACWTGVAIIINCIL